MAAAAALAEVDQCLQWIGFTDVQHRNSIIAEGGFNGLNDFFDVTETDIRDMAESFSKRSPAANRINFGMRRIKWLIAMMHWCQDHQRCSEEPDIADFANADAFKEALQVSAKRALLRKNDSDQVDTISKAADPGKFKDEKKWPDWVGKTIGQQYCWCSLMWLMPLRSLSNCDYELNFYLRLILGPIHSNQVMGTDPVGSYHGTRNSRSNSVNPTYRYQLHD